MTNSSHIYYFFPTMDMAASVRKERLGVIGPSPVVKYIIVFQIVIQVCLFDKIFYHVGMTDVRFVMTVYRVGMTNYLFHDCILCCITMLSSC